MTSFEVTLPKREWAYTMRPAVYDIPGCDCGNNDVEWSEYQKHLWCSKCQRDFIPTHNGIFDGPIPVNLLYMMGIKLDRHDLVNNKLQIYNIHTMEYE